MPIFPLSSRTIGYLVDAISTGYSASNMGTLFLKAEVDEWQPDSAPNKEARALQLLRNLRYERQRTKEAHDGALELARLVMKAGAPTDRWDDGLVWWPALRDVLAADGLEYDTENERFVPMVPGAQVPAETGWLDEELQRRGWTTAAGHYRQAVDSFAAGNWASANGQLRAFFEEVVRTAGGTNKLPGNGQVQAALDNLDSAGHLVRDEGDFAKKFWKLLHPRGAHPGLSDQDESRFRLLAITGYARFLITRLPG